MPRESSIRHTRSSSRAPYNVHPPFDFAASLSSSSSSSQLLHPISNDTSFHDSRSLYRQPVATHPYENLTLAGEPVHLSTSNHTKNCTLPTDISSAGISSPRKCVGSRPLKYVAAPDLLSRTHLFPPVISPPSSSSLIPSVFDVSQLPSSAEDEKRRDMLSNPGTYPSPYRLSSISRPDPSHDIDVVACTSVHPTPIPPGDHHGFQSPLALRRQPLKYQGPPFLSVPHHSIQPSDRPSNFNSSLYASPTPTKKRDHPLQGSHHQANGPIINHSQLDQERRQSRTCSRRPLISQLSPSHSDRHSLNSQHRDSGFFTGASGFSIRGSVMYNIEVNNTDNFMADLLKKTIPGAGFDSSDRNPPPRCHPGTRLAVIGLCKTFITSCSGEKKLFWLVGFAGVGKTAIMQSISECNLQGVVVGASVFFSVNGRFDGSKTITTLAYQLAVKFGRYRQFIQAEATADPSLFQKSLPAQFKKLIVEPFIYQHVLPPSSRLSIIIDGLDECSDSQTQWELLDLISEFCITYPTSPLVWLVASRPEPHITSFFSLVRVKPAYLKEEILVASNEAREDVERFLREEFKRIQESSDSLSDLSQWPQEEDFLKIAKAAGGLFAYASTVIKYIGDSAYGDPSSQLRDVLKSIDATLDHSQTRNPMAQLDSLYDRIMSNVRADIMEKTRALLLLLALGDFNQPFIVQCNLLGLTRDDAYGAVHLLRSILRVPLPHEADREPLETFHKSFLDYLSDFTRSKFSPDIEREFQTLQVRYVLRILKEVPNGVDYEGKDFSDMLDIARGSGNCGSISLAWPTHGNPDIDNDRISFITYVKALEAVCKGFRTEVAFRSVLCLRTLTNHLIDFAYPAHGEVLDALFDETLRQEHMKHGILHQVPLKTLASFCSVECIKVRLRRPTIAGAGAVSWHACCHEQVEEWEADGNHYSQVLLSKIYGGCFLCDQRFDRHLKTCLSDLQGLLVTSSSPTLNPYPTSWVEFRFTDLDDGVSEWTYYCVVYRES